jgi:hypothetical protein
VTVQVHGLTIASSRIQLLRWPAVVLRAARRWNSQTGSRSSRSTILPTLDRLWVLPPLRDGASTLASRSTMRTSCSGGWGSLFSAARRI